jgi:hypothetical protein
MKFIILRNDYNGQVLPISEGIVETQANLNLAREITWQHETHEQWRQHKWQTYLEFDLNNSNDKRKRPMLQWATPPVALGPVE